AQVFLRLVAREEEETIETREVAVDVVLCDDALDAVDRGAMARRSEPRTVLAVQLLEVREAVIHRIGELRGGAPGLAVTGISIVEHDDGPALLNEVVCGAQTGHAGADDAHVGVLVAGE